MITLAPAFGAVVGVFCVLLPSDKCHSATRKIDQAG